MVKVIDLRNLDCKVLSGTKEGEEFRKVHGLDFKDHDEHTYEIILPDDIYSVVGCFFIAAFSKSVRALKSFNAFNNKYVFKTDNNAVMKSIYNNIQAIIRRSYFGRAS